MRAGRPWLVWLFVAALALVSCADDDGDGSGGGTVTTYKVAVIMPGSEQERWSRVAEWALENIDYAQAGLSRRVRLDLVWQDEESADWEAFAGQAADDDSFVAIVGPKNSVRARRAAQLCQSGGKTLILPVATSTELQRIYAGSGNVWNLSQSDITQCELLLTQARLAGCREVSLLASDDDYGKSFTDWFAFQATELGLEVGEVAAYRTADDIRLAVRGQAMGMGAYDDALVFAPSSAADALVLDAELVKLRGEAGGVFYYPKLLCSDVMFSSSVLPHLSYDMYEGLAPSATPESGFNSVYQSKFGEPPLSGEAHLFDALTLLAYALADMETDGAATLNDAILRTVSGRGGVGVSWLRDDMAAAFSRIRSGAEPNLGGVTGDWTFDERTHASVLNTTYCNWVCLDGRPAVVEYLSTDGSARTISTVQAWEWQTSQTESFDPSQRDSVYPAIKDRWAVVVGGSDDWVNYRHQADALAMYQLLRRHGYDDSHIILVMEDNLADNPNNIYPGVVKVRPDGENLYHDVCVDYRLSDISFSDLRDIMLGRGSARLPEVVGSGPQDNVIMFWCGHGNANSLAWGSYGSVSGDDLRSVVGAMHDAGKYRKFFFALDACYSGTIGEACEGVPGLVVMTAANPYEPSKADMKDTRMGLWLSNGFTRAFQDAIDANAAISLRDLYYTCARHTVGSHAMMYNVERYGNVFRNTMAEFLGQ